MSLGKKLALFILLVNLLTISVIYVFSRVDFQINTLRQEDAEAAEDAQKAIASLDDHLHDIDTLNADYAGWDDTYDYVQKPNSAYVKSNFVEETFTNTGINFVLVLDLNGQVVFAKGVDLVDTVEIPVSRGLIGVLEVNPQLRTFDDPLDFTRGYLYVEDKLMMISLRPIVTSEKHGPIKGTLVMARYIDPSIPEDVREATKLNAELFGFYDFSPSLLEKYNSCLYAQQICIVRLSESKMEIYSRIDDLLGNAVGILKLTTDRSLYKQLQSMLYRFLALLAIVAVVATVLAMFFMKMIFVKRLEKLMHDIAKIKDSHSGNSKVRVFGKGELDSLALYINDMLRAIDSSRDEQLKLTQRLSEEKKNIETVVQERTFALQEEHARLLAAINTSPSAFMVMDLKGNIVMKNQLAQDLVQMESFTEGFTQDSLIKAFESSIDLRPFFESCVSESRTHRINELEWQNKVLNVFIAPVRIASVGKVTGILVLVSDITSAAIHERSKDEFFSIASHELRTPLTVIKGYVSMLKTRLENIHDKDMLELLHHVQIANEKIISIVNNLLTVALLEQNKLTFNIEPLDISNVINEVVEGFQQAAHSKNITLTAAISNVVPTKVLADKAKVKQILSIMIGNAVKYTSNGGVTISIENAKNDVKILIKDTGAGISAKEQNLLFRKFQQAAADIYSRDAGGGTGLELYIAKLLVDSMKGTILLENSVVGSGSTFSLTLPKVKS